MIKSFFLGCLLIATNCLIAFAQHDSGLLFYQSCESYQADVAVGAAAPNFVHDIGIIPDGARGSAFRCPQNKLLSYWAQGNIHAQRGTLAFYWRAGIDPLTETEFPIFRVGYADHSSPDMMWLRIDYNGHGFDAFVTDINLARIRTSVTLPILPGDMQWTHFTLTWDETRGIRFYINGEKAGQRDTTVVLDAALDQFGTHSYLITPYKVETDMYFRRGGDVDEIRIYDHALDETAIRKIAKGEDYRPAQFVRAPDVRQWDDEWAFRYGWAGNQLPPALESRATTVRKVQILEAYDQKTWWWKANDGIRETTWPGVYNRSRIIGRTDYFISPDWFCYSTSGQQVRFNMPAEPWNYLEISGGADGDIRITPNRDGTGGKSLFTREKGRERTFHRMETPVTGQTVTFTNLVPETPIGVFDAYYVHEGDAPAGITRLGYTLSSNDAHLSNPNISEVLQYIRGRHPVDERSVLTAISGGRPGAASQAKQFVASPMPIVHVIVPSDFRSAAVNSPEQYGAGRPPDQGWYNLHGGLDGIRITLPPMSVPPVANGLFPLNIQVKDPIWSLRNMLDFSFSMKPNEEHVLWLDLRDRILPNDKPLYLTIAGSAGFNAGMMEGARIELVFKNRNEAKAEHITDRFTQVRDNYAMIIEETPNERRLNKYVQLENDLTDLLRIDPDHKEGREYWYKYNPLQPRPPVYIPPAPAGVPLWAHLQLEYLKKFRYFVEWQIDHRQIDNGEFGGGLSDDSDFTNYLPPLALLGAVPDKIDRSLNMIMEAIYDNDMLENGMSKIQSDGLHTYEEGVNVICQLNLLRIGDPKEAERMIEAAYAVKHHVTGVNSAGHTHFRSDYFSATKSATKGVWGWAELYTCFNLLPSMYMGQFYGNETARQNVIDIADGMLAHADTTPDGQVRVHYAIHFETDEHRPSGMGNYAPAFWASWCWTGDDKYLKPLSGSMSSINANTMDLLSLRSTMTPPQGDPGWNFGRHQAWQLTGDKKYLEIMYRDILESVTLLEYINTHGYIWTDRLYFHIDQIQRSRLGGVCHERGFFYTGNAVSWRFPQDGDAEKIAILVPFSTPKELKLEFFNTEPEPMEAYMTGWDVLNGEWELVQGIDENGDGKIDRETVRKKLAFGRDETVTFTIPPRQNVLVHLTLAGNGADVTGRPDLAIGPEDIRIAGDQVTVTVHNLGFAAAPATEIALTDRDGKIVQTAVIPALEGVHDLLPKRVQVKLTLPPGLKNDQVQVVIDPNNSLAEIRKTNNRVIIQ